MSLLAHMTNEAERSIKSGIIGKDGDSLKFGAVRMSNNGETAQLWPQLE